MCNSLLKAGLLILLVLMATVALAFAAQDGGNASVTLAGDQFNGTTYRLSEREVETILPVNGSSENLTLFGEAENITLFDESGRSVSFNQSYEFKRGDHIYSLTFERPVQGRLVYSIERQGQQFILPIKDPVPVRIILPRGYTTGERSLGIARPQPDMFVGNESGDILTWNNTTQIPYIEINYYRKSAPEALIIILAILAATGLVLLAQYFYSIRKLKAARMEMEEERN
jgi:hypothetical protein